MFEAALALPHEDREKLLGELIISLDADQPKDPDYDRLWAEEIQRRWAGYEQGEVELIEHEEAMRRLEAAIQRGRKS